MIQKTARILDRETEGFDLTYDNNIGQTHTMRLDALTYERAIREAKSYLGINGENLDPDGNQWEIE